MTANIPSLATDFPIWYRDVSVETDEARQSLRIAGIRSLANSADRDIVEGLVRLAFSIDRQTPSSSVLDRISQGFQREDPAFDPTDCVRELQVLAGACLVEIFGSHEYEMRDFAALSVSTAYLGKARKTELPMDLATIANLALDQCSVEARIRPDLREFKKITKFKVGEKYAAPAEGEEAVAVNASDLATLSIEIQAALKGIGLRQIRMVNSLEQFIRVQDEELQVLWWSLGGRSTDLDSDFSAVPASAQPLIFSKEIADQTYILPGFRTVRPLMARAGLSEKAKLSLPEIVNGSPVEWLKGLMDDAQPSPVTQPLHFAIFRRLEVKDDKSWIEAWSDISGIEATQKFGVMDLGEIFYREQLLRQFS